MKERSTCAGNVNTRQRQRVISLNTKQQYTKARNIPVTHVTTNRNLTTHKQSRHEGKKYPCDSCDYQATERGHITTHKQSKHEGKKYPCDYQATYVTIKQLKEDTLPLINSHNIKARPIPVTHVTIGQLLINSQNMKVRNIPVTHVTIGQLHTDT
jgi:hypothetical protein